MEKLEVYIIPDNFEETLMTSGGIKGTNIIEGVICTSVIYLPILLSSMNWKVKAALIILLVGPLAFFFIKGIDNCSLIEYLKNFIRYHTRPKIVKVKQLFAVRKNDD